MDQMHGIRPEVVSEVQDRVEPDKMPSVEVADRRTQRGSEPIGKSKLSKFR